MPVYLASNEKDNVRQNFAINQLVRESFTRRTVLSAATTYYVNGSTGSDGNNGITPAAAFATIQHAYNVVAGTLDLGGQTVTIQVSAGTYTGGLSISGPWTGGGKILVQGDAVTPSNVIVNPTGSAFSVSCALPGQLTINGFQVGGAGTTYGIQHNGLGSVLYQNLVFAAVSTVHIASVTSGAVAISNTNYTISGGAQIHWQAINGGKIQAAASQTITLTGTPAFSGQFAQADTLALIYVPTLTFSGSATGTRYLSNINSVINTGGAGATYFPGNSAGSATNGGLYV